MRKRFNGKWIRNGWWHVEGYFFSRLDRMRMRDRAVKMFYGDYWTYAMNAHPELLEELEVE